MEILNLLICPNCERIIPYQKEKYIVGGNFLIIKLHYDIVVKCPYCRWKYTGTKKGYIQLYNNNKKWDGENVK